MTTSTTQEFGRIWFNALNESSDHGSGSLLTGKTTIQGTSVALAAVVPDPDSAFPRARKGEVGLRESLALAAWVRGLEDPEQPIVLLIDVPSQAYGYTEELFGINFALAASTEALAQARLDGRPIISLLVGKAISGAFLATGLQSNRILALNHDGVQVQVMSKKAAARITQRTVEELDKAAESVPAMAFDLTSFTTLGAVDELLPVDRPDAPTDTDVITARQALGRALDDIQADDDRTLRSRLSSTEALTSRTLSLAVREAIDKQW